MFPTELSLRTGAMLTGMGMYEWICVTVVCHSNNTIRSTNVVNVYYECKVSVNLVRPHVRDSIVVAYLCSKMHPCGMVLLAPAGGG